MKVAIVHDELVRRGGAEQVVLDMHKAYPEADIFTLCYNKDKTYEEFKNARVFTSWFQYLGKSERLIKMLYFPFAILAMRMFNLKGYDVVLISTTHCGKFVRTDKNASVITYCHTPFRLAWRPFSYSIVNSSNFIIRNIFLFASRVLRKFDSMAAKCTDFYLTNSKEVKARIEDSYNPDQPVKIINPAAKLDNFYISDEVKDYHLVVSRLEDYKMVDLVVKSFNEMPDKKLIIVGTGSKEAELKELAGDNITFLKAQSAAQLADLYANCKALVFPQHEDYGITPLEAAASGRPVIAFGVGGVKETMVPYTNDSTKCTSVFFEEQTVESLIAAIHKAEQLEFNPKFIRNHANLFSAPNFIAKLSAFVSKIYILKTEKQFYMSLTEKIMYARKEVA
ncbi:glycosyltransferase [Pedobacter sp. MR2016-24]|uniref:glycosyltransferase n=1 Tax=Pedobacter sp. MR2016-24 TaxID=2994466 RepID=UPI00224840CF|nr:glycosyltransferase [Pedobacter sp. MR2016-24]MCX2486236.1 glycosyltransferase [Pedobacter sp. MR2016-24]